jgi:glyoxylase-like metal-dependent hydrolase (beta-lactamase superfamily II)
MRIHPIRTGEVRIRERMRRGRPGLKRRVSMFSGPWTEPLPILAWAIEHDEGVIVVDTGETSEVSDSAFARFDIGPEDEIGPGLLAVGIDPADVRTVVLTHMHGDHINGIAAFPEAQVLVSAREARFVATPGARIVRAITRQPLPPGLDPLPVSFDGPPLGAFKASHPLTKAGDVSLVPAPGHTPGHSAVLIADGDLHVLIAGDSSYDEAQLLDQQVDAVSPRASVARGTMQTILRHATLHPTVYLPSHDPESAERLAASTLLPQA